MTSKYKILCIIPARGGSKGVLRKNVKLLCGKPLIGWTIDEAKKSKYIDKIVVSTEDEEIAKVSKSFGVEVMNRPTELSQDASSTIDVLIYTLENLKNMEYIPDYVLLLQCTSPLRTVKHIDEAISIFLNNDNKSESLISVTKEEHPPWWMKKMDENGNLEDFIAYDKKKFKRRQDFPEVFRINGAIYLAKTDKLYKYKNFEMKQTFPYVMDVKSSMDIDTQDDFEYAEYLLLRKSRNKV